MSLYDMKSTDDLNVTFRFPEKDEIMHVSSVYEDERYRSSATVLIRILVPAAAILMITGIIWLLTESMPELRKYFLQMLAFPCVILGLFALWEILKRVHLSNLIQKVRDGSFMLAEVQYADKRQTKGYYKQTSFNRFSYYVTVRDSSGNSVELKAGKIVFDNADTEDKLFLVKFVSGRGYWNKLDLYSSGIASSLNIMAKAFGKK